MANWISWVKDDLGTGGTTRDGMITNGPSHGIQLSTDLPPLTGITTCTTLHLAGQLKDGDNAFGTSGQVLSSDGTDTRWVSSGSLAAGAASQVAINDDSNANASRFLTFVDSSSGNNSVKTDPQLTYNPSTNVISTSGIDVSDNSKIRFGGGNDLRISHTNDLSGQNDSNGDSVLDGSTWASYIQEAGSGPLIFKSNGGPSTGAFQFYDTGWRPILKLFSGTSARVGLYHAGSEKLVTSSTGITVTGTAVATAFSGPLTGNVTGNVSGNAGTATKLATARNIGGVSFDGSAAINLPGVNQAGNQNTSGNAATATVLATARDFSISGDITANAISFNGNGNVVLSATIDNNAVDKACMADESVGEAELHISNSGTNGQFLCKRSGNAGGLTWETVAAANAGTLQGNTLASSVLTSSLTSIGTLGSLSVTNNITVGGNVDGRDVSADGTKLDTIESNATADQTAAEIRSLVNSASDSNVFTNTLKTKLDNIASSANNYTHPSHPGDDFSIDTGHLSGATVIDDLDINVTTDGSGHVTDCNATVGTRNLTLGNLGFTGATNANYITNTNQLTNGAGFLTSLAGAMTGNSRITVKTSGSGSITTQSWCRTMIAVFVGGGGGGGSSSYFDDDDDPSSTGYGGAGGTGGVKFYRTNPNGSQSYSYSIGGGGGQSGGGGNTTFAGSTAGGGGGGQTVGTSGNGSGGSGGSGDMPGKSGGTGGNNRQSFTPFFGKYGANGIGRQGLGAGPTSGEGGALFVIEFG